MVRFAQLWDDKVKGIALKCVDMELLTLTQMRNPTEEQKAKYEELKKKTMIAMVWRIYIQ
jgi:hypothetical protein